MNSLEGFFVGQDREFWSQKFNAQLIHNLCLAHSQMNTNKKTKKDHTYLIQSIHVECHK